MQFSYQARDTNGQTRSGEITADDATSAALQLRQDGLYLLGLVESVSDIRPTSIRLFARRVTRNEIVYFTNQLAIMVDAGVPLAGSLEALARQLENPTFATVVGAIQQAVEAGDDFSTALSRHSRYFNRTFVNLVKASEASGTLGPMLERIATQLAGEMEIRQKVKGALLYPLAMMVMCISVSIFLLVYVFPKLTPMFAVKKVEIPRPTMVMMVLSDALIHHWYWFVVGFAVLIAGLIYALKQPWGRMSRDWLAINIPILGALNRKVAISRSLRTLATTINAGVPMLDSLQLSAGVSNNYYFERCWLQVAELVTTGKQIHEALEGNPIIPATLTQMIASGEATGKLGIVLNKVSDFFDRDVENTIKATTSLIEPIMVAVMGCVIGTIALAMLLPIFKLSGHGG